MAFVRHAGAELYYEIYGEDDAPALIFSHGGDTNALTFAMKYPNSVRCLVLGHTPAGLTTPNILNTVAEVLQNLRKEEKNLQAKAVLPWERNSAFTSSDHCIRFLYQQLQTTNVSLKI